MRKLNAEFKFGNLSEAGTKLTNRDYFACVELDNYACYVVADGLDEDREISSAQLAVQSILSQFTMHPTMRKRRLKKYLKNANEELLKHNGPLSLKASVMVAVTDYMKVRYIMAGNTRFYLNREDHFVHTSKDQSLSTILYEEGEISSDIARAHEERNNLTTYLGKCRGFFSYVSKKMKLIDGDIILLASRGIWEQITSGELLDALEEATDSTQVLDQLEDLILAKQPDQLDNYTIATIFAQKVYKKPPKKFGFKKILSIIIPILIISLTIGIVLFVRYRTYEKNKDHMQEAITQAKDYLSYDNYERAKESYQSASKYAKKIKKTNKAKEYQALYHFLDQITQADEQFEKEKYEDAKESYQSIYDGMGEHGDIGKEYLEEQMRKVQEYMDIYQLLEDGDALLQLEDRDGAIEKYKEAKKKAAGIYYDAGRNEASDKIKEIEQAEAEEKKAAKEEAVANKEKMEAEAAKKEEEEKQAKEEEAKEEELLQQKKDTALDYESKGNDAFTIGDYESAIMYYETAKEVYEELNLSTRLSQVSSKLTQVKKKSKELKNHINEAKAFEQSAKSCVKKKNYAQAKLLYQMAVEIYEENGQTEKVKSVNEKIASINEIIKTE